MQKSIPRVPFKHGHADDWTLARISELSVQEIQALRDNAERLNEQSVVDLCAKALTEARSTAGRAARKAGSPTKARRLIARVKAFEARGVYLADPRTSWGGIRKSDGKVVMALWADAVETIDGGCEYLLWAPNVDGARPWAEKPAGQERLEHCKLAVKLGNAEGLLVYGQRSGDNLPEDKAYSVHGVDADTVLTFQVVQVGDQFRAKWGKKAAASAIEAG
jgi:hypothetical protein